MRRPRLLALHQPGPSIDGRRCQHTTMLGIVQRRAALIIPRSIASVTAFFISAARRANSSSISRKIVLCIPLLPLLVGPVFDVVTIPIRKPRETPVLDYVALHEPREPGDMQRRRDRVLVFPYPRHVV